jgi:hypothetical protein
METQTVIEKETLKETADDLVQHAGEYLETFYKKSLLQVTQKGVNAGAMIISIVLAGILGFFVLFFAGLGLGWWIGDLVNSRTGGFLIIAGFYLLLLVIIMASKRSIISSLRNRIIRKIYD